MKDDVFKIKIFWIMCKHHCSLMDGWVPYPSTIIQRQIPNLSLYKVRKYLKELKQEGYIDSELYVDTSWDERPVLVRGYNLTSKGANTHLCDLAHERERRICKECFDFDIGKASHTKKLIGNEFDDLDWLDE